MTDILKVGLVGFACLTAGLAVSSCAPSPSTIGVYSEHPAKVKIPRDSNGNIDFAELDRRLSGFVVKNPHKANRPCKGNTSNCLVEVRVQEIGLSRDIRPEAGPNGFRIIGTVTNTSLIDTEGRYDLAPNTKYYVWVEDANPSAVLNSKTVWGLLQSGGNALVRKGYVMSCHRYAHKAGASNLDFEYCEKSPTKDEGYRGSQAQSAARSIFSFVGRVLDGRPEAIGPGGETWFECDPGCCTGTTSLLIQ